MSRKLSHFLILSLFSLLAVLVIPASAQKGEPSSDMIDNFKAEYTPDGGLKLTMTYHQPDGCMYPLTVHQERAGNRPDLYLIDLVPDDSMTDLTCTSDAVSQDVEVQVDDAFVTDTLQAGNVSQIYFIINDAAYFAVPLTTDDRKFGDPVALRRDDVEIESVVVEAKDGAFALTIKGMHQSTCIAPDVIRQNVKGHTIKLVIYQPVAPDAKCPQTIMAPVFNGTVPLNPPEDGAFAGIYVIDVNGYQFTYDFDAQVQGTSPVQFNQADNSIESVDVVEMESFPVQLVIKVKGYRDGCDFPVEVDQTQDGSTIKVHIYRNVPADIMCTMIAVDYEASIPLGAFQPGEYTIDVNGTIVKVSL